MLDRLGQFGFLGPLCPKSLLLLQNPQHSIKCLIPIFLGPHVFLLVSWIEVALSSRFLLISRQFCFSFRCWAYVAFNHTGGWKAGVQHGDGYQVRFSYYSHCLKATWWYNKSSLHFQTFANGNIMDGHWMNGKRDGGFIFTFPNGERLFTISMSHTTMVMVNSDYT